MTQPTTPQDQKSRRPIVLRVSILGTQVCFERKKLWPQGPEQALAAKCAFEVGVIQMALSKAPSTDRYELQQKLRTAEEELENARQHAKAGSQPVEAIVMDMYEIAGDQDENSPPRMKIFSRPFGEFEKRGIAMVAEVPLSACLIETLTPIDQMIEELEELENEEDDDEDDEDEDDEKEKKGEGGAAAAE